MTEKEAEEYIYSSYLRAAPFQDRNARDSEKRHPELSRPLLRELSAVPCTVVTGSKGKGSSASMLASLLEARMKTGLMTSPHLSDFRERFRVSGRMISPEQFRQSATAVKPWFDAVEETLERDVCISPMGIQAAAALTWFGEEGTQYNVFECGKGAQYDDVAGIPHPYAMIGSIFAEHTRELGSTAEEIAADKAHVMDGAGAAFSARQTPRVMAVLRERAAREGCALYTDGEDFRPLNVRFTQGGMVFDAAVGERFFEQLRVPLLGEHQAHNAVLALANALAVIPDLTDEEVRSRLAAVSWPARMEVLGREPFVMLDACVNRVSAAEAVRVLDALGIGRAAVVIGIPDDKDYAGTAACMSVRADRLILTKTANPHYAASPAQVEVLRQKGITASWADHVPNALKAAFGTGLPVVLLGTGAFAGEARDLIREGII